MMIQDHSTKVKSQSQGKVIISGEHSVVYGEPALVGGIKLFREVAVRMPAKRKINHPPFIQNIFKIFEKKSGQNLDQDVEIIDLGKLPIGSGLGSSAAFAHAIFLSLFKHVGQDLSKQELYELVQESESFSHGNPSGVDATAVVYGGLLEFRKKEGENIINSINSGDHFFKRNNFYLIDSGRPVETTREMVDFVAREVQKNAEKKALISKMGDLTQKLIQGIDKPQIIKESLKINHKYLEELGVVGKKAKQMVDKLEGIGAVAKITGAGGNRGGSGMILAFAENEKELIDLINQHNWKYYQVKIG